MAKASDNVFPKVILGQSGVPAAPTDGSWRLYAAANGVFARSSNTTVGPFSAGAGGSVATDTIWDAAGDLVQGTGADAAAKLSAGSTGQLLRANGASAALTWAYPPGYEYNYQEFTAPVSITATSAATANTVVTAGAISFDGSTTVMIEFFAPYANANTTDGNTLSVELYDGSSDVGHLGIIKAATTTADYRPLRLARRITPSNASHTYGVRAFLGGAGTGSVGAGAAGSGAYMPGFIRITQV